MPLTEDDLARLRRRSDALEVRVKALETLVMRMLASVTMGLLALGAVLSVYVDEGRRIGRDAAPGHRTLCADEHR